jgi:thioesterase domain-containing protein
MKSLIDLQTFLHQEIPLTKDMGLQLVEYKPNNLVIKAPLSHNINDKGSVFGGSSSALMIISAWSLIKLNCDAYEIDADIVIHKNETLWQKAMYQDMVIVAKFNSAYCFDNIKSKLMQKRHQRISCRIELQDGAAQIYSTMTANYVIIPKE